MLPIPQSVPFPSYIVFCHQVQGHLHLDKSIVPWIESLITMQCVLFCPCMGYLPFWKIKKFGFFSIANPVLSYFQYIFAHCFTSKLRKIKRKDEEIKKINNLILRKMIHAGLELTTPDSTGQCDNHCATKDLKLSVYLSYWGWILLILRSPKGGCCSILDDLSCSIYRQPIFISNLNTDKTVSMQSELFAFLPTS